MWEIILSGGLGHRWPTQNSWCKGERKEKEGIYICIVTNVKNNFFLNVLNVKKGKTNKIIK